MSSTTAGRRHPYDLRREPFLNETTCNTSQYTEKLKSDDHARGRQDLSAVERQTLS